MIMLMNTKEIAFSQSSISQTFSQGKNESRGSQIAKVAAEIVKNPELINEFPPLHVFFVDVAGEQKCFSLDNRRLFAFKSASKTLGKDLECRVQVIEAKDICKESFKLTNEDPSSEDLLGNTYSKQLHLKLSEIEERIKTLKDEGYKMTTLLELQKDISYHSFFYERYANCNKGNLYQTQLNANEDEVERYVSEQISEHVLSKYKFNEQR